MRTVTRKVAADETALLNKISQQRQLTVQVVPSPTPDAMPPLPTSSIRHRIAQLAVKTTGTTRKEERPGGTASTSTPITLVVVLSTDGLTNVKLTNSPRPLPTLPFRSARNPMTLSLVVSQESYLSRNTRPPDRRQTDRRARHPHPQRRATGRALAR